MTFNKRYFLGWILLFFFTTLTTLTTLTAQSKYKLEIYMYPTYGVIKIDSMVIDFKGKKQPVVLELPEGEYTIAGWAPKMQEKEMVIQVRPDTINRVRMSVHISEEYNAYRKRNNRYYLKKLLPYPLFALNAITTIYVFDTKFKKESDSFVVRVKSAKLAYEAAISPEDIAEATAEYNRVLQGAKDAMRKKNKKIRRKAYIGVPVMLATYGITFFAFRRSGKMKKPVYQIKNSPFSSIEIQPDFSYGLAGTTGGFSLKLKF